MTPIDKLIAKLDLELVKKYYEIQNAACAFSDPAVIIKLAENVDAELTAHAKTFLANEDPELVREALTAALVSARVATVNAASVRALMTGKDIMEFQRAVLTALETEVNESEIPVNN